MSFALPSSEKRMFRRLEQLADVKPMVEIIKDALDLLAVGAHRLYMGSDVRCRAMYTIAKCRRLHNLPPMSAVVDGGDGNAAGAAADAPGPSSAQAVSDGAGPSNPVSKAAHSRGQKAPAAGWKNESLPAAKAGSRAADADAAAGGGLMDQPGSSTGILPAGDGAQGSREGVDAKKGASSSGAQQLNPHSVAAQGSGSAPGQAAASSMDSTAIVLQEGHGGVSSKGGKQCQQALPAGAAAGAAAAAAAAIVHADKQQVETPGLVDMQQQEQFQQKQQQQLQRKEEQQQKDPQQEENMLQRLQQQQQLLNPIQIAQRDYQDTTSYFCKVAYAVSAIVGDQRLDEPHFCTCYVCKKCPRRLCFPLTVVGQVKHSINTVVELQ